MFIPCGRALATDIVVEKQDLRKRRVSSFTGVSTNGHTLTSRFPGVTLVGKRWRAVICHDNERHYLGTYDSEEEAAGVYAEQRKKHPLRFQRGPEPGLDVSKH